VQSNPRWVACSSVSPTEATCGAVKVTPAGADSPGVRPALSKALSAIDAPCAPGDVDGLGVGGDVTGCPDPRIASCSARWLVDQLSRVNATYAGQPRVPNHSRGANCASADRPKEAITLPERDHDQTGIPAGIGQPARCALTTEGYTSLEQLMQVTAAELGRLHESGPRQQGRSVRRSPSGI
jgi:hypothetical protein